MSAAGDHHGRVYESRLRVRYAETDQMGVVYHSNFFIWFEIGRVEMFREMGFTYETMEQQDGCHLPVADARCRFKAPARYDDEILLRTRLKNVRSSMIHFAYDVLRAADSTLLAEGETVHIVTDAHMNICPLPPKYRAALEGAVNRP